MKYQLVLIALAAFTAGTRGRLLGQPNFIYDNGGSGGGDLVDDEDYEGSGGHNDYEVSGVT